MGAVEQAVFVLGGDEARHAHCLGRGRSGEELGGAEIGGADGAHLAGLGELLQRPKRLLHRRRRVRLVHPQQVDRVGLEPPQAGFDRCKDIGAAAAMLFVDAGHRLAELGGKRHLPAPRAQHLADDRLRAAAIAVDVGGVEMGDAEIQCLVDDLARCLQVETAAELIGAEADQRHLDIGRPELAGFHGADSL